MWILNANVQQLRSCPEELYFNNSSSYPCGNCVGLQVSSALWWRQVDSTVLMMGIFVTWALRPLKRPPCLSSSVHDLQHPLLGSQLKRKSQLLVVLPFKKERVKNHGDGHENGAGQIKVSVTKSDQEKGGLRRNAVYSLDQRTDIPSHTCGCEDVWSWQRFLHSLICLWSLGDFTSSFSPSSRKPKKGSPASSDLPSLSALRFF